MSIRRLLVLSFVVLSAWVAVIGGVIAWREASRALETEMDRRATWIAGAAAETGLQSSLVTGLEPGFERATAWTSLHSRLVRLKRYVREAYILDADNRAMVSSWPADSVPIGTSLPFLEPFAEELAEARRADNATTPAFEGSDGLLYKWGFARLEQSDYVLAVLMPADYLSPLSSLWRNLLLGAAVAAALAAVVAAFLSGFLARPVERLSRVAMRIQRGRMDEPVDAEAGKELGRLSRAMERMRRGIVERDEQLRLMLAQVAHEIRNPLGGLELFASAAADTDDPVERRRLLDRVRAEVGALNGIIEDFLTFARPSSPEGKVEDLRIPIQEAADLVRAELEAGGGRLLLDVPDRPLTARADPDQVKRIVLNLLRNAAQVASTVRVSAGAERGEAVVRVADDGPGVAPGLRPRIFDPFVSDKEKGAGLGLAIVKKLAEANGGRVELAPERETDGGEGAEFRVYFPGLEDLPVEAGAEAAPVRATPVEA